jgi:hypothetical protein
VYRELRRRRLDVWQKAIDRKAIHGKKKEEKRTTVHDSLREQKHYCVSNVLLLLTWVFILRRHNGRVRIEQNIVGEVDSRALKPYAIILR